MARTPIKCQWISLREALTAFAENVSGHQGSAHIMPLHWYVACRMVVEGGFHPEDITPRPPFTVTNRGGRHFLEHNPEAGSSGERTILGGLKTKDLDVVVTRNGIGPVIAVSMKGTLNAFRKKYEAVALALVNPDPPNVGQIIRTFPPDTSPLLLKDFFAALYAQYDQRFIYAAPRLEPITHRLAWAAESPALNENWTLEYGARIEFSDEPSPPRDGDRSE